MSCELWAKKCCWIHPSSLSKQYNRQLFISQVPPSDKPRTPGLLRQTCFVQGSLTLVPLWSRHPGPRFCCLETFHEKKMPWFAVQLLFMLSESVFSNGIVITCEFSTSQFRLEFFQGCRSFRAEHLKFYQGKASSWLWPHGIFLWFLMNLKNCWSFSGYKMCIVNMKKWRNT